MCNSKIISLFFVIFYVVLLYFAFNNDMGAQMMAMKMMAVGMLLEAIINLIVNFMHKRH
ncbi:hypothetical protein [Apilactobacillus micheneri]|uniref:hypothetical protein n=1 Tax=Apilactobacillus micheneri TaxID=1899430 RepID=UPI000D50B3CB|nr:hypothetical protein [Apilactobacillus micheneri]GAY80029.1 hypothetical protein NBRC113063_00894 [Apilactobacillus micheneri]